jgi:hypothetical protein
MVTRQQRHRQERAGNKIPSKNAPQVTYFLQLGPHLLKFLASPKIAPLARVQDFKDMCPWGIFHI